MVLAVGLAPSASGVDLRVAVDRTEEEGVQLCVGDEAPKFQASTKDLALTASRW
jgi:hypothetical protein